MLAALARTSSLIGTATEQLEKEVLNDVAVELGCPDDVEAGDESDPDIVSQASQDSSKRLPVNQRSLA